MEANGLESGSSTRFHGNFGRLRTSLNDLVVCPEGLEPPTCCLEGNCSIQLSYGQLGRHTGRPVLVGAAGFELATYWSQTSCATRLRYAPNGRDCTQWGRSAVAAARCRSYPQAAFIAFSSSDFG